MTARSCRDQMAKWIAKNVGRIMVGNHEGIHESKILQACDLTECCPTAMAADAEVGFALAHDHEEWI